MRLFGVDISLAPRASTRGPLDDYWYAPYSQLTAAGIRVTPETAMRLSAVWACVQLISRTMASLPLKVYRRLPDGAKVEAFDHPLYRILHDRPNSWQTAYQWRQMMAAHLELRGNAYNQIVPGLRGEPVGALIPIHPDRVTVKVLSNGRLAYDIRQSDGTAVRLLQEDIFHLCGLTLNGYTGLSTVETSAEGIAVGMATQEYVSRFFENDATPSVLIKFPGVIKPDQQQQYSKRWQEQTGGKNRFKVGFLDQGGSIEKLSISAKDAQLLEERKASRTEIASIFGVQPHKIGDLEHATFSNIEEQNIEFATDCIRPRAVQLEQTIARDLIAEPDVFAEHSLDALLRAKTLERYQAYAIGRQWGFISTNDICRMENRNTIGPEGDMYLQPMNMVPAGTTALPAGPGAEQAKMIVASAAVRMVRRELGGLKKLTEKAGTNKQALAQAITEFYAAHAPVIVEVLALSADQAAAYIDSHRSVLLAELNAGGVAAAKARVIAWEQTAAPVLASLALEGRS